MKICVSSDLHHGFDNNTYRIHQKFFTKMAFEEFDVLILAGDLCSHQQRNLGSLFRMIREHLPDKKILAVRGNHDLWNREAKMTLSRKIMNWKEECNTHSIVDLNSITVEVEGIKIYGWHNWYGTPRHRRGTNDEYHLTIEEEQLVHSADMFGFQAIPLITDVLVSYMPIVSDGPTYDLWAGSIFQWAWLKDKGLLPRLYIHGHTHKERDEIRDGARVVMCGSDYNQPKYKIIEI